MAKGYLSFGVAKQGEIDQSVIVDYAQTMQDWEWKAGSILIFSEDYKIIDGYYRLAAVASVRGSSGILSSPGSTQQSLIPVAPSVSEWGFILTLSYRKISELLRHHSPAPNRGDAFLPLLPS